jgi:hypothetical protein
MSRDRIDPNNLQGLVGMSLNGLSGRDSSAQFTQILAAGFRRSVNQSANSNYALEQWWDLLTGPLRSDWIRFDRISF